MLPSNDDPVKPRAPPGTCARIASSLPVRSMGVGSSGGVYLMPAPVSMMTTRVSAVTWPLSFN